MRRRHSFLVYIALTAATLLRHKPLGYLLTSALLVFADALGSSLLAMGIGQQLAGLMSIGQFIGFVVSFAILTLIALGFTAALFRNLPKTTPSPAAK